MYILFDKLFKINDYDHYSGPNSGHPNWTGLEGDNIGCEFCEREREGERPFPCREEEVT